MDKFAAEKTKKVVIWIINSGVATALLIGLSTAIESVRDGEADLKWFGYTVIALILNGLINAIAYYLRTAGTQE